MSLSGLYFPSAERGLPARTILGVVVVAILLPTLMVAGWLATLAADAERAQIERNIEQHAREISVVLDREVAGIKGMLTALGTSASLHNGNLQGFHAKAVGISRQFGLQIALFDRLERRHVLNTAAPYGAHLTSYSFPQPLVEQIVGTRAPIVTGVMLSPIRNRYSVAVVLPVRPAPDLDYLISASIDADKLAEVFNVAPLQPHYVAAVVDRDGVIVARSSRHHELVGTRVQHHSIPPGMQGEFEGPSADGVDFHWFYHRSPITGWTVLIGAPRDVFEQSFKLMSKLLAGAALALFAVGLTAAYCIGGGFSRAVSEIGHAARELPRRPPPQSVSSHFLEANRLLDDLKAASLDLRSTDAQQRFAIKAAGIGTWSWDLVSSRLIASPRTCELYGLSASAEPTMDYLISAVHPADRDLIRQAVRRCFAGVETCEAEFRVLGTDGSSDRWLSLKGRVERDASGTPVSIHGAVQDITDRRTSEHERVVLLRRLTRAQEAERLRLAHELHDQTAQSLTAAQLELKRIEAELGPGAATRLAWLRSQLEDMAKTAHRIAYELRPPALDIDLRVALSGHLADWGATYGICTDFQFNCQRAEGKRLPDEVRTSVYRIVQEALTNVARHAREATAVSLVVNCRDDLVQVTIEDDGRGFDPGDDPERARRSGLGLAGMRERAALVGGHVEIESSPGVGTTVFVRVPLQERRQVA